MTYQTKVIKEKKKLDKKLKALNQFLEKDEFLAKVFEGISNNVSELEQQRLKRQAEIMKLYSDVLAERISNFNVDVEAHY